MPDPQPPQPPQQEPPATLHPGIAAAIEGVMRAPTAAITSLHDLISTPQKAYQQGLSPEEEAKFGVNTFLAGAGMRAPIARPNELGTTGGKPDYTSSIMQHLDINPDYFKSIMQEFGAKPKPGAQQATTALTQSIGNKIAEQEAQAHQDLNDIAHAASNNYYHIADKFIEKYRERAAVANERPIPINWMALQNSLIPPASIPKHAVEAGFNPNYTFTRGGSGKRRTELADPSTKRQERGIFFAENPKIAKEYHTGAAGAPMFEYVARPQSPAVIDLGGQGYDSETMHRILENARAKGHDLVVVSNVIDIGSGKPQNQIVVLDPKIVRYPSAQFDPDKFHINDMTAAIVGAAGAGAAVTSQETPQ
jgi:hypothetical protein